MCCCCCCIFGWFFILKTASCTKAAHIDDDKYMFYGLAFVIHNTTKCTLSLFVYILCVFRSPNIVCAHFLELHRTILSSRWLLLRAHFSCFVLFTWNISNFSLQCRAYFFALELNNSYEGTFIISRLSDFSNVVVALFFYLSHLVHCACWKRRFFLCFVHHFVE